MADQDDVRAAEAFAADEERPFKLVKFLSWSSLVFILGAGLFLAIFIANQARDTLLEKQKRFALLLADNVNHQIFQRFTLPTLLRFRRIELQNPEQYAQLDRVVGSTIHGLHVLSLRIFDADEVVSYATDTAQVGREDLSDDMVRRSLEGGPTTFEIISDVSSLWSMFYPDLEAKSVILRTVYTLRAERSIIPGGPSGQIMGVLEFTQDITEDYATVVSFQWLIIISSFLSSLVLFLILVMFIRRAARIVAERAHEQRRLERELHQSERLASMGRVVAGIAHEIRNPLGIIKSSAQLLLKKAESAGNQDPGPARILQAMYDEIGRLSQTVNDFLDYARPRQPRMHPVNLAQVLDQAMVFLEREFTAKGVVVARDYPTELPAQGDKDLLYRAVFNILVNAVQALDGAGTITIRGRVDNGAASLVFADSGPGFAPEALEKVADPFFTTKDHGTGLGLAIVSTILDSHGADLAFSNAEGGGAQVTVTFPAA
ncbi:MAG: ATP-binding protein [Thermodesulfobacteriota bacterium]